MAGRKTESSEWKNGLKAGVESGDKKATPVPAARFNRLILRKKLPAINLIMSSESKGGRIILSHKKTLFGRCTIDLGG